MRKVVGWRFMPAILVCHDINDDESRFLRMKAIEIEGLQIPSYVTANGVPFVPNAFSLVS